MSKLMDTRLVQEPSSQGQAGSVLIDLGRSFDAVLLQAVEVHESYIAARSLEREAQARIGVASSVRRPQLTANAGVGTSHETGSGDKTTSGLAGGLNVSQLVFDGGESAAAVNRATAEALGARAERVARANEVALQAARAWIDLWQYDERLRLLRTRTSAMSGLVSQIERMATNGMLDRAILDNARRQIVDITLEDTRLQSDLADARVRFRRYFGQDPERIVQPAEIVSLSEAQAHAAAWRNAPVLQSSAATVIAAQNAVAEAESAFLPRASLQAGLRSPISRDHSTEFSVRLGVEYKFGDGGRRQHQLESAQAQVEARSAQLRDAQTMLEGELQSALIRLAGIERAMPLLVQKLRLSQSEAETTRAQIATGQSNLRQLVEAEVERYRARDQHIAMQAEKWLLQLTIAARTGALATRIGLDGSSEVLGAMP